MTRDSMIGVAKAASRARLITWQIWPSHRRRRDGPAAIPRRNGEPVFNEPWESRVFGMAVGLCERGFYDWDEFRDRPDCGDFCRRTRATKTNIL